MLPTIKLSSVDDIGSCRSDDATVEDLWNNLSSKDLMRLQEIFSTNGVRETIVDGHSEEANLVTRYEFINAIFDICGSQKFQSAANLVFNAALTDAAPVPTTTASSPATTTTVSAFTAFKTSLTSSSSSSTTFNESVLSLPQGGTTSFSSDAEGRISWRNILRQFLPYVEEAELNKETLQKGKDIISSHLKYFPLPYTHREEISCILIIESHYLTVGNKGQLNILNKRFCSVRHHRIHLNELHAASESTNYRVIKQIFYQHRGPTIQN